MKCISREPPPGAAELVRFQRYADDFKEPVQLMNRADVGKGK
jgi:hypothetical protein